MEGRERGRDFIERQVADAERLRGSELQPGVTLLDAREFQRPTLGSDARSGLFAGFAEQLNSQITTTYLFWRRGPVAATVAILAFDAEDRAASIARLAAEMDLRIDGVLAGEIAAPPPALVRPALPTPIPASTEGFDVEAMVPTLDDVPAGATLHSEGPVPESAGALKGFSRRFAARESPMQFGT